MSEKVDRVARAIYEKRNGSGCTPWSLQPKTHKAPYLDDALVAIEAMREPAAEMLAAGLLADDGCEMPGQVYRAMIDAALNPAQT